MPSSIVPPADLAECLRTLANWATAQEDPATVAEACLAVIDLCKGTEVLMSAHRDAQLKLLHAEGWSVRELAEAFDRHPSRIYQLLRKGE